MSNNYSSIVSGILAQALVTLPRITAAELYEKCAGQIGDTSLAQFRIELSKWITDGTIPGYEARKGPTGGLYRKGSKTESKASDTDKVKLDATLVIQTLNTVLETQVRITAGDLFVLMRPPGLNEGQFRQQLSQLFEAGELVGFDSRKGPTGGIYRAGSESEKFIRETRQSSDDNDDTNDSEAETEAAANFSLQISPSLKIVCSDDRNWTIQKLSGETWQNKAYLPDLNSCIRSVVKHAINGEFRVERSLVQLKDVHSLIRDMENRIVAQLEKHISTRA